MQENFEDALKAVLVQEGGFVTHPDDPGGSTTRRVTLTVFQRHFPGADVDALRGITDGQVANIYHVDYWSACRCDELAAGIDYAVFDQAVNSGPSRSIRWLQQAVDAGVDGVIGPETIRLANAASVAVERMCDERLSFMQAPRGGRQRTIFGRGVLRKATRRTRACRGPAHQCTPSASTAQSHAASGRHRQRRARPASCPGSAGDGQIRRRNRCRGTRT